MPRPPPGKNRNLKIIHRLDPHFLCVPSLHIAVVALTWTYFHEAFRAEGMDGAEFADEALTVTYTREGEEELVHELLTDENAWLRLISEGGTRTFEGWYKDLKWNTSLFHLTLTLGALFLTDWDIRGILRFSGRGAASARALA